MATAFTFGIPFFDSENQKWYSNGIVYTVTDNGSGVPGFIADDAFNPAKLIVSSPTYEAVKQAWANVAQQVDAKNSAAWAAHDMNKIHDTSGKPL